MIGEKFMKTKWEEVTAFGTVDKRVRNQTVWGGKKKTFSCRKKDNVH